MNTRIGVDILDGSNKLVLRDIERQQHATSFDTNLFTAFERAALVGQVVLALAHTDDSQRRNNAALAQRSAARGKLLSQSSGDGSTL